MSTRATVYIHWNDWEMDIKLYHHRDGYVSNLGVLLDRALKKRVKQYPLHDHKTMLEHIIKVGGFEQARPIHWDVEYIYHIQYWTGSRRIEQKREYERYANYKLECQSWMEFGEDALLKTPKVLLSMSWDWQYKKLNWKQAEKDLWNIEKRRAWYLD